MTKLEKDELNSDDLPGENIREEVVGNEKDDGEDAEDEKNLDKLEN